MAAPNAERYDRAYFDHWYRKEGFGERARLDRKARYALAAADYLLEHPVRNVLDIGCGEAPWRAALRRQRPAIEYLGVDPSAYVVERYGRTRNIVAGSFGELEALDLGGPFDLIVCADVILYVSDRDLRAGLRAIVAQLRGVAYLEVYTANDRIEGDLSLYRRRRPTTYDRMFAAAGLSRIGPHLYVGPRLLPTLADFEGRWPR